MHLNCTKRELGQVEDPIVRSAKKGVDIKYILLIFQTGICENYIKNLKSLICPLIILKGDMAQLQ